MAVSKNSVLVATGGADKTVRIYNFADGKQLGQVKAPAAVRRLAFSPNNQVLAAACDDKSIVTWNVTFTAGQPVPAEFGKPVQTFAHAAAATDVVFAPTTPPLLRRRRTRPSRPGSWPPTPADARTSPTPTCVDAVAFNPAGTLLATGCHDGNVRIWDVPKATGPAADQRPHHADGRPGLLRRLEPGRQAAGHRQPGPQPQALGRHQRQPGPRVQGATRRRSSRRATATASSAPPSARTASCWPPAAATARIKIWNVADGNGGARAASTRT